MSELGFETGRDDRRVRDMLTLLAFWLLSSLKTSSVSCFVGSILFVVCPAEVVVAEVVVAEVFVAIWVAVIAGLITSLTVYTTRGLISSSSNRLMVCEYSEYSEYHITHMQPELL